jgi:glycerol-3-phosphate dehydrogenase (NAD(P)+)
MVKRRWEVARMTGTEGAVAVMGAGAWGTALAKVLAEAGSEVGLWARRPEIAEQVNATRENPEYLPGVRLPSGIRATTDAAEALRGATTVLLGVPAQTMRANLERWTGLLDGSATLASLAKGIELDTLMRMSQVIVSVTGVDSAQVAVLSGPNLATEIAAGQPAATVIACSDSGRAVALQRMLNTGYFRPYTNADVIGTEIGGACKNVIALACGMAAGVGLGENTGAAIITRGLAEIIRLGIALGAKGATLAGLAGVGDLVATCTSSRSRNRSFGERLGRGETMDSALATKDGHVVEGVTSCQSVLALASSYDVEMPLTDAVHRVCHKGLSVDEAVALLLGRSTKPE